MEFATILWEHQVWLWPVFIVFNKAYFRFGSKNCGSGFLLTWWDYHHQEQKEMSAVPCLSVSALLAFLTLTG